MPEAADIVANADVLLEAKLFDEAVSSYTKAIELIQSPNYFIKRLGFLYIFGLIVAPLHIKGLESMKKR